MAELADLAGEVAFLNFGDGGEGAGGGWVWRRGVEEGAEDDKCNGDCGSARTM